jgi:hypothetical protein
MASTQAKAIRRADVLGRLSAQLGIQQADLHANAKGDPELALIMTLERIATAIDGNQQAQQRGDLRSVIAAATDDELIAIPGIGEKSLEDLRAWAVEQPQPTEQEDDPQAEDTTPPVTVETVQESEMQTTETVEIKPNRGVTFADPADTPVNSSTLTRKGKK